MKRLLQQNPGMLNALLQNIGQSNPELLQIISQNQEAFIRMINESDDTTSGSAGSGGQRGGGRPSGEEHLGESGVIQVSPQDKEAIERVSDHVNLAVGMDPFLKNPSCFWGKSRNTGCPIWHCRNLKT